MARKITHKTETQADLESGLGKVQHLESWSNKIEDASERFLVLAEFNDEAVLDKETQLVWERKPSTTTYLWQNARFVCAQKAVGWRGGWRLPSFYELSSLVDPSVQDASTPSLDFLRVILFEMSSPLCTGHRQPLPLNRVLPMVWISAFRVEAMHLFS